MPVTLQNKLQQLLSGVRIPWSGESLASAGAVIKDSDSKGLAVSLQLGYPAAASAARLQADFQAAVAAEPELSDVKLVISWQVNAHAVQGALSPLPGVRNIIVVSSAKGGVGKSTIAANLALALAHEGARVGILDADIYGPSQPLMLGIAGEQPVSRDGKTFEPLEAHGLQVISIGCLIDTEQPMVWRGPMVTQALNQLLFQTNWENLDYLIVDMPPGTGDIQLTLGQKVPVSGAVIVTTPQDIALADALRGLRMFEKLRIPVLGLVENMSSFVCPGCGEVTPLFGDGGAPTVVAEPDSVLGLAFRDMALYTVARLAERPRDYKGAFSGIKIEKA